MIMDYALGRLAFETYTKEMGLPGPGLPLKKWEEVHPRHQGAWQMAAEAVYLSLAKNPETKETVRPAHWLIYSKADNGRFCIGCTYTPSRFADLPGITLELVDEKDCLECQGVR